MAEQWQSPAAWEKDGASITDVSSLKKGAWTSILKATETHDGKTHDVIIKTFSVPAHVLEDPERIAREREKFLAAARLQMDMNKAGARGWVRILRLSEDPANPSFSMEKCGPSVQDFIDNKAQLGARELYQLTHAILQSLIELKEKHKRSHGSIKPSDVLSSGPGGSPAFKLADPAAKGEDHSANDLYALGLILYELVEGREYDPLNPITPTRPWSRFGAKRDKWIQFCTMLLNPNGCHETLQDVKREAGRLKPSSPLKYATLALAAIFLIGAGAVGYHLLINKAINGTTGNSGNSGNSGNGPIVKNGNDSGNANNSGNNNQNTTVDPAARAAYDDARQTFQDTLGKWSARQNTPRYDHTASIALARAARAMTPDGLALTTSDAFKSGADAYKKATAKFEEAIAKAAQEEDAGEQQDAAVFADLQRAQRDYLSTKSTWDQAFAKFTPARDHTASTALARAATINQLATPTDPAEAKLAAKTYRNATAKINDAIAMAEKEDLTGASREEVKAAFENARKEYTTLHDQWTSSEANAAKEQGIDLVKARAAADEAKKLLPDQVVLTDLASYQTTASLYNRASAKLKEALAAIEEQRQANAHRQGDVATAITQANDALKAGHLEEALTLYRRAAELGNVAATYQVGLLYDTGQGTRQDPAQAAQWYQKAAALGHPKAILDLAYMYETGRGIDKDYSAAAELYKKAAANKNVDAMNRLGLFSENGWGMPQDYAAAMNWYKQAAALDDLAAMTNIGVLYDKGRGVKQDPTEAMKWYMRAADKGSAAAMNDVGVMYDSGRGVKTDYAEAMKWYKKAADKKYAPAITNIGVLYDNGLGVKSDPAEALKLFNEAAAPPLNYGLAMFNIGFMYERGRGTSADIVQAVQWYRRAVKADDPSGRQFAIEALDRLGYAHQ